MRLVLSFGVALAASNIAVWGCSRDTSCQGGAAGCACINGVCLEGLRCVDSLCTPARDDDDNDDAGISVGGRTSNPRDGTGDGESGGTGVPPIPDDCGTVPLTVIADVWTSVGGEIAPDDFAVTVGHKQDVDPAEDGCINRVELTLRRGSGCQITVQAGERLEDGALAVASIQLAADSQCPGFPDPQEGDYSGDGAGSRVTPSQLSIGERNVATSCFRGTLDVALDATLHHAAQSLAVSGSIAITGDFTTSAFEAACPGDGTVPPDAGSSTGDQTPSGGEDACADPGTACDSCICDACLVEKHACDADEGCTAIMECRLETGCSGGILCWSACEDVYDKYGGTSGDSAGLVLDLVGCTEDHCEPPCD